MFKGNQDSSEQQNQHILVPIIQKNMIIDPKVSVEHLICSICFHVVWDPVVCGSVQGCHNVFCSECIGSWLQKSNKLCPTCKKQFAKSEVPPILISVLQSLQIKCSFNQNGCQQILRYNQMATHLRQCQFKIQRCKGCKKNVIQRDLLMHIMNCDQFMVECNKCKVKMTKAALKLHNSSSCYSKQIDIVADRVSALQHNIQEVEISLQKLCSLTNCFLNGEPLQMNIELYTTFNQHFIFPNPTLIKPSFNQIKQKFDFLHFYVLNPIYTQSIVSIKWGIKINKMIGNILLGFCSSMNVNSIDFVINKYGDLKKKNSTESKYKLVKKSDGAFSFGCGDIIKFRYVGVAQSIRIWNQTKRVGMVLNEAQVSELGEKIYTFYSMDTLNDSISFI